MDFKNILFSMPLLVGVIFIITGFIMLKFPPKNINMLYGYRTSSSMKSKKRWNFAQIYSSKLIIYGGFGLALSSVFGLIFTVDEGVSVIISTVMIFMVVLILMFKTERAIKQRFRNE